MSDHAERNVKGCLRFAVTAPWCIVLEKDVVLVVDDYIFVVVGDNDLDVAFLLFGNGLGFDAGLHLAVNEFLDECTHVIMGEFLALIEGEFLVLHGLLDGESGPLVHFQVQVTSVGAERFGVNGREAKRSLVLLCERLESLSQLGALLGGLGEDVGKGNTGLKRISWANWKKCRCYILPCSQRKSLDQLRQPKVWMRF